ncbi:MFS general substrate transporter [Choiromyces venosus 120613-1]|uniref:MFS general substrate transporter n=1 Tax=Choiromyces venosus 120613-1 TaxID=1336337 RepID=A0A3N4J3F3_9PEZI|nr:MFS general substrate transporter [Choiromyces venosus 120613-1]
MTTHVAPIKREDDETKQKSELVESSPIGVSVVGSVQSTSRWPVSWRRRWKIKNLNGRIFVSGFGLFADGYLSGIIGVVNILMRKAWPDEYTPEKQRLLTSITFAGIVIGQLGFGWFVDRFGRRNGMKVSGIIIIVSSLLTAIPFGGPIPRTINLLAACRFFTGVGIGGEYPSGSVACAEAAALRPEGTRNRWFIFCTNIMILGGFLAANLIPTAVVASTGEGTPKQCTNAFHILFGIGTIFALIVFIFRRFVDEGEQYEQARRDKIRISYKTVIRYYWRSLAVESLIWFLWNVTSFSYTIFAPRLVEMIGQPGQSLVQVFGYTACIMIFHFPGAVGGAYLSDRLGPRVMLVLGSFCQVLMAALLAGLYAKIEIPTVAFIFIFGFFAMFGEAGAGNNIGLIVSQSAATPVRGKFYGVAAACGKVGGFIGTHTFVHLIEAFGGEASKWGISGPFFVCGGIALVTSVVAWWGLRNVRLDQKSLDNRDREFAGYMGGR